MSYDNQIRLFVLALVLGAWLVGWAGFERSYE